MEIVEKPLISILMAVYEPRMDWLKEQLDSLNAQTYPNLRLYIRDDASPKTPLEDIRRLAEECITAFPFQLERNEENLGSNGTFELLTREAEGEFYAYCDQDDVWLPEKLEVLYRTLSSGAAALVCSDVYVVDENGCLIADSITKLRRRHKYLSGDHLAPYLMIRNFIIGCTMLIPGEIARRAVPFERDYVHDQWLGIVAAAEGKIVSAKSTLIRYRQHGGNQTGILHGVDSREQYYRLRIDQPLERFASAMKRVQLSPVDQSRAEGLGQALISRRDYVRRPRLRSWFGFAFCPVLSASSRLLDTMLPFLPDRVLERLIRSAQEGRL